MAQTYFPERKTMVPNREIIVKEYPELSDRAVRLKKKHDLVKITIFSKQWLNYIKNELAFLEKYNSTII